MARPTHEELAVYLDAHLAGQDLVPEQDLRWWCLWALDKPIDPVLKAQIKDALWSEFLIFVHPTSTVQVGPVEDYQLVLHVFNGLMDMRVLLLIDFDWKYVFCHASGFVPKDMWLNSGGATPDAVITDTVSTTPFEIQDVKELIGLSEGERDEQSWLAAGQLYDGRWFIVRAGCDYTGWD